MSGAAQTPSADLVSSFDSTAGGVMTVEVGAITSQLGLLTRPTRGGVEALVRYSGARDLYTVAGSPVQVSGTESLQDAHQRILQRLTTPGTVEDSNELPVDLSDT